MNVGNVISMLVLAGIEDCLLMRKGIYNIIVDDEDECIMVTFTDGNTADIKIYKDGEIEYSN